jgi:hypothetical protein
VGDQVLRSDGGALVYGDIIEKVLLAPQANVIHAQESTICQGGLYAGLVFEEVLLRDVTKGALFALRADEASLLASVESWGDQQEGDEKFEHIDL